MCQHNSHQEHGNEHDKDPVKLNGSLLTSPQEQYVTPFFWCIHKFEHFSHILIFSALKEPYWVTYPPSPHFLKDSPGTHKPVMVQKMTTCAE